MGEPKRYGLIIPNKKTANKPVKKLAVFGSDSSDDEESAHKEVNLSLIQESQKKRQMKQTQIEIQKALKDDPTVYEYDAVYDDMEEKKKAANAKLPEKDRKPKYIEDLLKSAAARKREFERTVERQVQKEREKEDGEFDDKEAFVTEAFRKKMQEQAEEEERLKRQDAIDAANDVTKQKDLSLFYRNLLNRNVSLGGSFTGDDATKKDLPEKEDSGNKSEQKDKKATEENRDERKHEKHINKDENRHSRRDEEIRRHPKSPVRHSGHHDHDNRKRRDSESDEEHRRRSQGSSDKERRRQSDRDRDDRETHRHSSHSERHRSSRDDRRHSENSERSRTSHDDRRDRDRKRGERDRDVDKASAEKVENESAETVRESKEDKEASSKEPVSKFAKRSTGETVLSAKERYLARKRARDTSKDVPRNGDDSDD